MSIKFGTDGWRAIIGDQYTFANLERVSHATARWLHQQYGPSPKAVVGYDTRFQGENFAKRAAAVLASEGIEVLFSASFTSTPAISWATFHYGYDAGIAITASHNPPEYNGFKIKGHFGGSASPEMIAQVEEALGQLPATLPPAPSFDDQVAAGRITFRDLSSAYLTALTESIDVEAIRNSSLKVAHDAMYGAGQGMIARLLRPEQVVEFHAEVNPGFHGQAPEPIERNLEELARGVVATGCDAAIANDGDADRIGMYDEQGQFVSSHLLLALLTKYMYEVRGLRGDVVKTNSTTHMLDKMGEAYGLHVETTKIGFKYIGSRMVETDILVGGEESGGMAAKGHIPERDGIYIGLLILEMMVKRGKKLSALVQELYDAFGPHHHYRVDVHTTNEKKAAILQQLDEENGLSVIDGHAVVALTRLDGYKHLMADRWLLVRPSGTEPVLRIYSEAETPEAAQALVMDTVEQLGVEA